VTAKRKFGSPGVKAALANYGFQGDNHERIIVSWGWTAGAAEKAKSAAIELWDFRILVNEIAQQSKVENVYFLHDTVRTLHLFILAQGKQGTG
jgi:hypothetical protein